MGVTDVIEEKAALTKLESAPKSKLAGREKAKTLPIEMTTVAATTCFNCNEARYARSAVRGPYTTGEGPCPKSTGQKHTNRMNINSSKHTALRKITAELSIQRPLGVNLVRDHGVLLFSICTNGKVADVCRPRAILGAAPRWPTLLLPPADRVGESFYEIRSRRREAFMIARGNAMQKSFAFRRQSQQHFPEIFFIS